MTAFHEVQFPTAISYGAQGGPGFNTTILPLASGNERRNQNWEKSRGKWNVAHGVKTAEQYAALVKFFYARRGRVYGFRFKDWLDYQLPFSGESRPTMMTTNGGVTTTFQIVKVYSDAAGSYTRNITKPVSGTIAIYDNGVLSVAWTASYTTGIVTLTGALAASTGHIVTMSCEFDVPVRFDIDDMQVSIQEFENFNWGPVPVVELRV